MSPGRDGQVSPGGLGYGVRTPSEMPLPLSELARADAAPTMRIGEIAARLGLSHRSIRHYEDEGLITPASRTPGGFRLYSMRDLQRFLFIMSLRPLGFSLEEISRFLTATDHALDEDPARRQAALTILDEFTEMVEERWLDLKQQLDIADRFRTYLNREVAKGSGDAGEGVRPD